MTHRDGKESDEDRGKGAGGGGRMDFISRVIKPKRKYKKIGEVILPQIKEITKWMMMKKREKVSEKKVKEIWEEEVEGESSPSRRKLEMLSSGVRVNGP